MAQTVCPKCGSTNVGTSTAHKLKKGATYAADFALGYLFGDAAVNVMSETGGVSDNVSIKKEFQCRNCGYIWKDDGVDRVPDEVLIRQMTQLHTQYKSQAQSALIWGVVSAIVTVFCAGYCFINDFTSKAMENNWLWGDIEVTHYNWTWLLLCIVGICTFINTNSKIKTYTSANKIAQEIGNMTVTDFRYSNYRR
ncbi:MAG: hypothetical protein IJM58_01005 [Muribaculaceae bacterium]|nr:hypothetical protein [Muribaculaceae bacterium]